MIWHYPKGEIMTYRDTAYQEKQGQKFMKHLCLHNADILEKFLKH